MRLLAALLDWLGTGRRGVGRVLAVALALTLSCLLAPLISDDWLAARKLAPEVHGPPLPFGDPGLHDVFVFGTGDPAVTLQAQEQGYLAWWAAPDIQLAFFRPLSALTHALDHTLWPHSSALMHAQGLAWFAVLVLALGALYRRLLGPRAAVLALALYAWDDARGMVLSFVANRNALLAGLCGVGVLWLHDRWRRDGWRPGAVLGPLLLGVGLLTAELALATTAFLFAYSLFLDAGSLRARLARLLPYAGVVLAWQLVYKALGYGVVGSGVYTHPLQSPALFASRFLERAPVLLLGQLGPVPADLAIALPRGAVLGLGVVGLLLTTLVGGLALPVLRQRAEARFFVLGGLLSVVPVSAVFASDRNLTFVGVGGAGLLALVLLHYLEQPPEARWRRWTLGGLLAVHLVLSPLTLPLRSVTTAGLDLALDRLFAPVLALPDVEERTLVVVWTGSDGTLGFGRVHQVARGDRTPRNMIQLCASEGPATVTRLDDRTLRIEAEGFLAHEGQQMVRGPVVRPFQVGDEVVLSEVTVTVREVTEEGLPRVVEARFVVPLEDPRWIWTVDDIGVLAPVAVPGVGEAAVVVGGMPWTR